MSAISEQMAALKVENERLRGALKQVLEPKPDDDPKDGPCCHEQDESGYWRCCGCYCGNYDDAAQAARWAERANRWKDQEFARAILDMGE